MTSSSGRPTVAVIGGGFSGAATAYHLATALQPRAARIVVIEPRVKLGAGLAYSTDDPAHRVNVPASKLMLDTRDPLSFERWIESSGAIAGDPDVRTQQGDIYPRRSAFGSFVAAELEGHLRSGQVEHLRTHAVSAEPAGHGYALELAEGDALHADIVVLAVTHGAPLLPVPLRPLEQDPRLVRDPYAADALAAISPRDTVLIVGTGLTAADIIASLERRGHQGSITALSRHGLLSRPHAEIRHEAQEFGIDAWRHTSAPRLLKAIRQTVRQADADNLPWQAVLDAVRRQGPSLWSALPAPARKQLLRHLRSWWDVHRFRVAPQVAASVSTLRDKRQLVVEAARLVDARAGEQIEIATRSRGGGSLQWRRFDHIVLATGPDHGRVVETHPVLRSFADAGHLRADDYGLGIAVDASSRAIDPQGKALANLFVGGPLARGTFGELMGIPEVTAQAEAVSASILERLTHNRRRAS